ncbi:Tautomerase/MIF [Leucogyrophana mollusca]|uniref:Tautomerase/MIF n=1 Tax=Leucogyrophana mollusca TaxID=85980 RepID=A0ACB8BS32_9AGAM|nr:Tautomerase/MIF [Leucogyrophana mollusca]
MPLLTLITNVKLDDAKIKPFVSEFSKKASEIIGKPEVEFSIDFHYNPNLAFSGTFEPAVRLHVISLWNTNPENAKKWSKEFSEFFLESLGVSSDRGHMAFTDPGDAFLGFKGTTVAALRASS